MNSSEHFDGFDAIQILGNGVFTNDKRRQVFLGRVSGSGGFLAFFVLGGDTKGNIKVVLDRMDEDWPQGQLLIDDQVDKKIYIKSNGKVVETLTGNDFSF